MIEDEFCQNETSQRIFFHEIEAFGYRYVNLTICLFGIVCNLLNLCVLFQRRLKQSPYTYLTGLAFADISTLIFMLPLSIVRGDFLRHQKFFSILALLQYRYNIPLANYFGQISIMIILALTIERYLFTTYPLKTRTFCQPKYARIVVILIIVLCIPINLPRFFIHESEVIVEPFGSFNSSLCHTWPFLIAQTGQCLCLKSKTREFFRSYRHPYFISMFVLNQISPFFILLYLNFKLINRVQNSNHWTRNESEDQNGAELRRSTHQQSRRLRDENRLTKTLVSIVLVFLVCNTFTIVSYPGFLEKLRRYFPNYSEHCSKLQTLITNIMLLLNYSINFFFYCAFNRKFRDCFKLTFLNCRISRRLNRHRESFTLAKVSNSQTPSRNSSFYSSIRFRSQNHNSIQLTTTPIMNSLQP